MQFAVRNRPLHGLIGRNIVVGVGMMQDHQINVIKPQTVKRCVDGGIAVIIVACPHLCGNENVFSGNKAFADRPADTAAHASFIPVNAGGVDQAVAVPQRPVDGVFRLLIRESVCPNAQNRHGDTVIEHHGSRFQIKYPGLIRIRRWIGQNILQILRDPFFYCGFGLRPVILCSRARNGKTICHHSARAKRTDRRNGIGQAAPGVSAERNDGFTGEVIALQEMINDLWHIAVPNRIAKEYHIIEMGPEAGAKGGLVIAQGDIPTIEADPISQIGPFLSGTAESKLRVCAEKGKLFENGRIHLSTDQIHTVKPLEVDIPKGRLTVVTGVSGSGKTTMVLESLIPALEAKISGGALPEHIRAVDANGIAHVKLIDATPIGINVRSTVATYAGVHDELRKLFAKSPDAKANGYKAGDFSYNTGSLRCPGCDGTGVVSLDVQFLPDVDIPCPDCRGSRYSKAAYAVKLTDQRGVSVSLPELMAMDVNTVIDFCKDVKSVSQKLGVLKQLGLGYLTLGEETPGLSGGEAQRLKLASEIGKTQEDSVFVFDEPSIGLHPLDVRVLLNVFQALLDHGATVVVIEHDLDVIRNADYIIDMGPGGGEAGGRIIASGTPREIKENQNSITGKYLS